jgi:lipid-A-disaccharide synthase
VRRLLGPFVEAARRLLAAGHVDAAHVIAASSLDPATRTLVEQGAARSGMHVITADAEGGAMRWLRAFDAALAASGTASLEAALAGASPVVAYRMDRLGFALARRLVRTSHMALPNVLLDERVYPELVQDEVTPARLVAAARSLIGHDPAQAAAKLRALLAPSLAERFGLRVARLCADWLGVRELGRAPKTEPTANP